MDVTYFSGLDLGQQQDYTALAVAERTSLLDPDRPDRTVFQFALRHLQRDEPALEQHVDDRARCRGAKLGVRRNSEVE